MADLAQAIRNSLLHPIKDDKTLDPLRETAKVLEVAGFDLLAGGGAVTFEGCDPILSTPLPLATMAGVSLMAKAVAVAAIWRFRTGEAQDLSVKLGQVIHRLCPFYDARWELLNGYPPGIPHDPLNPFLQQALFQTRDNRWIQFASIYPRSRTGALAFLGCNDDKRAVSEVVRRWEATALEEAANRAGLQANMVRTPEEFMATEQFASMKDQPLFEIEKIGDSPPEPFTAAPEAPLDGVRALGLGHVIAGAGLGRALACHGADVLNIWRPLDFEFDTIYYTSNIGIRSATLDIGQAEAMCRFMALARETDVFFANRRPGYLDRMRLTAHELAEIRPGIIHVDMSLYGPTGPWTGRVGFDNNAGGVTGVYTVEGTPETPRLTEIGVVNDYAMAWLASTAVLAALKRRAVEGGSYRIRISLVRLSLWMLQMGVFDKAYARKVAGTEGDHAYLAPDLFQAETPCGDYQGVTDQVRMSRTPEHYRVPLVPRGSCRPEWLPRG